MPNRGIKLFEFQGFHLIFALGGGGREKFSPGGYVVNDLRYSISTITPLS